MIERIVSGWKYRNKEEYQEGSQILGVEVAMFMDNHHINRLRSIIDTI